MSGDMKPTYNLIVRINKKDLNNKDGNTLCKTEHYHLLVPLIIWHNPSASD